MLALWFPTCVGGFARCAAVIVLTTQTFGFARVTGSFVARFDVPRATWTKAWGKCRLGAGDASLGLTWSVCGGSVVSLRSSDSALRLRVWMVLRVWRASTPPCRRWLILLRLPIPMPPQHNRSRWRNSLPGSSESAHAFAPPCRRAVATVGTLNVQCLVPRLSQVLDMMVAHSVDILSLQETNVSLASRSSARRHARACGFDIYFAFSGSDLAFLARLPLQPVTLSLPDVVPPDRVQAVRMHRFQQRPLLLVNLHAHPGNPRARDAMIASLVAVCRRYEEDYLLLGDFNCLQSDSAVGFALANGHTFSMDLRGRVLQLPTRPVSGRRIDYALGTLFPCRGWQTSGPADHDAVFYEFALCRQPQLTRPAFCHLTGDYPILDACFSTSWRPCEAAFSAAQARGDATTMWTLLSDTAEDLLGRSSSGMRRSQLWRAAGHVEAARACPRRTPIAVRRLLRTLRLFVQLLRDESPALRWRLWRRVASHARAHGDVAPVERWCVEVWQPRVHSWLLLQQASVSRSALDCHVAALSENPAAQRRWLRGCWSEHLRQQASAPPLLGEEKLAAHPQLQAEEQAAEWRARWQLAAASPSVSSELSFGDLLASLRRLDCSLPVVTGAALRRRALQSRGKAAGADAWRASDLLRLPLPWWDCLADVWTVLLAGADPPLTWCRVVVALVPKPDGGMRPIGVLPLVWRLGVSLVVRQLAPWISSWMPVHIVGGAPGRGVLFAHLRLQHFLRAHRSLAVGLISEDISKAYDTIRPSQALAVLAAHGLPSGLEHLLRCFYALNTRIFTVSRCYTDWAHAPASIVQGCPLSPLLLSAIMSLWTRVLAPTPVSCMAYMDDRSYWLARPHTELLQITSTLVRAERLSRCFDALFGFVVNPRKFQIVASIPALCQLLAAAFRSLPCVPSQSLRLLGLVYHFTGASALVSYPALTLEKCLLRSRYIPLATRSFQHRRALLSMFVLSVLAWAVPAAFPPQTWLTAVSAAFLRAALGASHLTASRLLAWTQHFGLALYPPCALRWRALAWLWPWYRLVRTASPSQCSQHGSLFVDDPGDWLMALRDTLLDLGWRLDFSRGLVLEDSASPRFRCSLGWDGLDVLRSELFRTFRSRLLASERRVWAPRDVRSSAPEACLALGPRLPPPACAVDCDPSSHAFVEFSLEDNFDRRLSLMSGADVWHAGPKLHTQARSCLCGRLDPSMAHLVWHCSASAALVTSLCSRPPADRLEERLLLVGLPMPPPWPPPGPAPEWVPPALVRSVQRALALGLPALLAASDGSLLLDCATMGVALAPARLTASGALLRGASPLTWGGPLLLAERSAFAAELHALYLLLTALVVAVSASGWSGPIFCVLDSKAVLSVLDRPSPPLERWECWSRLRAASDRLRASRCTLTFSWVPSHGRVVPSWSLPWQVSKRSARELNAKADASAGRVHGLVPAFRPLRAYAQRRAEALRWQASALEAARAVMRAYLSSLRADVVGRL